MKEDYKLFKKNLDALYIPHGSDESRLDHPYYHYYFVLYIPHGSDESDDILRLQRYWKHFISHMVQMKVLPTVARGLRHFSLYPTWFRWKQLLDFWLAEQLLFISHMVQMKGWYKAHLRKFGIKLYIPHGSDERDFNKM